jgi:hypothetical protein
MPAFSADKQARTSGNPDARLGGVNRTHARADACGMLSWLKGRTTRAKRLRGAERYVAAGLRCAIGDVVDLSTQGVRVRYAQAPSVRVGDVFDMVIASDSQKVRVRARVAWIRRAGVRAGELGAKFEQVRPGVAAALVQLARFGFITTDPGAACGLGDDASAAGASSARAGGYAGAGTPVRASIEVEDLYALLGVSATASGEEIKRAYHARALELHPDRNPTPEAARMFADLAKAYRVLRNAELRARYDALLVSAKAA